MQHLANKLDVLEKWGVDPKEHFAKILADPDQPPERQDNAAAQLMPYCYPKLKQVELLDSTTRRRPEEIERDITAYVERVSRQRRDLIGAVE